MKYTTYRICFYCKGSGKVIGYELSQQYGTTSLLDAICRKCKGVGMQEVAQ